MLRHAWSHTSDSSSHAYASRGARGVLPGFRGREHRFLPPLLGQEPTVHRLPTPHHHAWHCPSQPWSLASRHLDNAQLPVWLAPCHVRTGQVRCRGTQGLVRAPTHPRVAVAAAPAVAPCREGAAPGLGGERRREECNVAGEEVWLAPVHEGRDVVGGIEASHGLVPRPVVHGGCMPGARSQTARSQTTLAW